MPNDSNNDKRDRDHDEDNDDDIENEIKEYDLQTATSKLFQIIDSGDDNISPHGEKLAPAAISQCRSNVFVIWRDPLTCSMW